ncbi:MAG: ABC transporter ATP-binding protein, partial [Lachnospiraceae bacterium]|nr:ABC transporter ATP-binding protein [Lachnospiraceae bacterium]
MPEHEKREEGSYVRLPWFGLKKLAPFLRPYAGIMVSMLVLGLIGSALDIVVPLFQSYALNHFVAAGTLEGLRVFTAVYLVVILLEVAANTISTYQTCQIEMYVGRDMKQSSFDHLQTLSFSYFNQNSVGYIHARVMSDTDRIGSWIALGLMDGVWNFSYLAGVVVVMFVMNWRLACFILLLVPVTAAGAVYFQRKLVGLNRQVREINSQITGDYNEGITGARTVKTLVIEEKMRRHFQEDTEWMRRTSVHMTHYRALFLAMISFSASCALALVLWRGGVISAQGAMEIGTLSVFMSYALGMMEPIQWIIRALSDLVSVQVN